MVANSGIPIIDISPFTQHGSQESRQSAASELARYGSINGCVGIRGHGVSVQELSQAFAIVKELFDLPYEDKMKAPHPNAIMPHRGYLGIGLEQASAKEVFVTDDETQKAEYARTTDFKESYEIGSEENKINYNIWLPEEVLPGFKDFALKLFWDLNKLGSCVLEALILSLDLTEEEGATVRDLHSGHEDQLRLLHYPIIPVNSLNAGSFSRLGAHTDFSLFTLLFQDENGGLEFQDRNKKDNFIPALPIEGVVYMNIGDMFERISNGFYPSAWHRVTIQSSDDVRASKPRYSIPYFVAPRMDARIEPPASVIKAHGKQNYEPIIFEEYATKMFEATSKH